MDCLAKWISPKAVKQKIKGKPLEQDAVISMIKTQLAQVHLIFCLCFFASTICNFLSDIFSIRCVAWVWESDEKIIGKHCYIITEVPQCRVFMFSFMNENYIPPLTGAMESYFLSHRTRTYTKCLLKSLQWFQLYSCPEVQIACRMVTGRSSIALTD